MNPTTELIQQAGAWTVACVLLLALAVVVLRLLSLPLALTAMALDAAAELAARPLNTGTAPGWRRRR